MNKLEKKKSELKPFSLDEIQVCPICGKIDVYKDDGHDCLQAKQNQVNQEYYD